MGILGGTFNPPHLGHLALARHALEELALARVLLMPVHTPPHKPGGEGGWQGGQDPDPRHRLRMCELLASGVDGLAVSPLEIDRGGPSYTVDTLTAIHASHPDAHLTLIVGADTASTLASWREPAKLLELADLAVASRPGSARQQVLDAIARVRRDPSVAPAVGDLSFLEMPELDLSSSAVRRRVGAGERVDGLVGEAVARYIAEHRLYRRGAGDSS